MSEFGGLENAPFFEKHSRALSAFLRGDFSVLEKTTNISVR